MNNLFTLIVALLIAVALFTVVKRRNWLASLTAAANVGASTIGTHHGGKLSRYAASAFTARHLLCKIGADETHVALCGAADIPLGLCDDEAEAAEDPINVVALGSSEGTLKARASAAIALGAMVVPDANGKVRTLPAAAGTYYIIGRALTAAAADGDELEIAPTFPVQRIVA